jgi:hypothetical protein
MDREMLQAKLAEIKRRREVFVRQAEQQVAAFNGAIDVLEELLREENQAAEKDDGEEPAPEQ